MPLPTEVVLERQLKMQAISRAYWDMLLQLMKGMTEDQAAESIIECGKVAESKVNAYLHNEEI